MSTDTEREKARRFAAECAAALGEELRAVLVHRDAGTHGGLVPSVLIVRAITTQTLRDVAAIAKRSGAKSIALPLLLDDEYLATSRDVFPLELLTLMDSCELLWGDSNPLDGLAIDHSHLRLEIEQQLKGKVLHLRQAYIGIAGDRRSLETLVLDSSTGFEAIMRGLLLVAGRERLVDAAAVCGEVERALGISLETFRTVQVAREKRESIPPGKVESLFERYLEELTALARAADRITRS